MTLRVVGAGPPRTGTESLSSALETLLGAPCHHMHSLPGHPHDAGPQWRAALAGEAPDWRAPLDGYAAAVDWPASLCWKELAAAFPDAVVLLSSRDSTETWLDSMDATVLPVARESPPDSDLVVMLERFAGTPDWDDRAVLGAAYDRWVADVRATTRGFVDWHPGDGWEPICTALHLPVPDEPFPWTNRREEWG
jgi:hypothetical protein